MKYRIKEVTICGKSNFFVEFRRGWFDAWRAMRKNHPNGSDSLDAAREIVAADIEETRHYNEFLHPKVIYHSYKL